MLNCGENKITVLEPVRKGHSTSVNGYKKLSKDLKMSVRSVQTLIKKQKIRVSVDTTSWSGRPAKSSDTTAMNIRMGCKEKPKSNLS